MPGVISFICKFDLITLVAAGKFSMATPYLSSLTRIRSVVQQQNHVMADHLRIPLLVLRRYYQVLTRNHPFC